MSTSRPLSGLPLPARQAVRFGLPAVLAAAGAALLLRASVQEQVLFAAVQDPYTVDVDGDGLSFHQESIDGTSDSMPDSDGDRWDDLMELAFGSDPLNAADTPVLKPVSSGMTARTDSGTLTLVTAVFAANGQDFDFEMGLSYGGILAPLPPAYYLGSSSFSLYPGIDSAGNMLGLILLMQTPVPEVFVSTYGYLGVYFTVTQTGSTSPTDAAALNLFDWLGNTVMMVPAPSSVQGGAGSIYKPLGRGEDLPSSWVQDEICWQLTSVVGTVGAGTVKLSIEDAGCETLDSYCNANLCQGGIGTTVDVLDAGAFTGQE